MNWTPRLLPACRYDSASAPAMPLNPEFLPRHFDFFGGLRSVESWRGRSAISARINGPGSVRVEVVNHPHRDSAPI